MNLNLRIPNSNPFLVMTNSSWQFNSTNEFRDVAEENVIVDGAVSVVSYVPRDESDYGTLLCWGRNELGRQRRPCVFHVIPAGEDHILYIPGRSQRVKSQARGILPCSYFQVSYPYKSVFHFDEIYWAIKACESQFLQMVIALGWIRVEFWRRRRRRRLSCFPNCSKLCWGAFSSSTCYLLLLLSS